MSHSIPPEDESLAQFLDVALHAASEAGKLIAATFHGEKATMAKSLFTDLVTQTDQDCEEVIKSIIQANFPEHKFIGEESSSGSTPPVLTDEPTWMCDPIDGK